MADIFANNQEDDVQKGQFIEDLDSHEENITENREKSDSAAPSEDPNLVEYGDDDVDVQRDEIDEVNDNDRGHDDDNDPAESADNHDSDKNVQTGGYNHDQTVIEEYCDRKEISIKFLSGPGMINSKFLAHQKLVGVSKTCGDCFFGATLFGDQNGLIELGDIFDDHLVFQACVYSNAIDDLQFIFIKRAWLDKCPVIDDTGGDFAGIRGPLLDESVDLIVMTRLQLLSSGILRRRVGHLSSFRPEAGDLLQYLFLNLLKDVISGTAITTLLKGNSDNAEKLQVPLSTKRKYPSYSSNKQQQALKQLSGFLSSNSSGTADSKQQHTTKLNSEVDANSSSQLDVTKKGRKKDAVPESAPKKKKTLAKVQPFTAAEDHSPAIKKKLKARGGKQMKKTVEQVDIQSSAPSIVNQVALEAHKEILEGIKRATAEQKRVSEDLAKQAIALRQREDALAKGGIVQQTMKLSRSTKKNPTINSKEVLDLTTGSSAHDQFQSQPLSQQSEQFQQQQQQQQQFQQQPQQFQQQQFPQQQLQQFQQQQQQQFQQQPQQPFQQHLHSQQLPVAQFQPQILLQPQQQYFQQYQHQTVVQCPNHQYNTAAMPMSSNHIIPTMPYYASPPPQQTQRQDNTAFLALLASNNSAFMGFLANNNN